MSFLINIDSQIQSVHEYSKTQALENSNNGENLADTPEKMKQLGAQLIDTLDPSYCILLADVWRRKGFSSTAVVLAAYE